jgi:asparagine synthase (glutamine-hydrolysing)
MCGICGVWGNISSESFEAMSAVMRHRGPDDSGIFQDERIALGMVRLAIIDLSPNAHQPMSNGDKSVWIVYNGETYNFQSEREILLQRGYRFNSTSDTEVVLHMYEEYGDDFLLRMRGMYALAIYDKRRGPGKERLLLARDHFGIKPLLYARIGSAFVFSSEMKSILASGLIEQKFDPEALRLLMTHGSITQPVTAISGVKMLLPGHRLIIESGVERIERFWQLGLDRIADLRQKPYEEQVHILRSSLEESVRLQMVSDVPVGAFLSGGVDSSLLVALMSKLSRTKVKTFSVGFGQEGAHIDETDDAQRIARFLDTDHTRVVVTGKDFRDKISHIAAVLDQPSVDGVNSYFISMAASGAVTVAISGTGGDELFAGYPWFMNMVVAGNGGGQNRLKSAARNILSRGARNEVFNFLLQTRYGDTLERLRSISGFAARYVRQYQIFGASGAQKILAPEVKRSARMGREPSHDMATADDLQRGSPIDRVCGLCLRGYTQNQLLRDIDAVSMGHSLEVRVPYLDPVIADVALSLPDHTKLGNVGGLTDLVNATYRQTGTKRILIDAGRDLLPEGIDLQSKRGFGMPFDSWLRYSLADVLEDTLSTETVKRRGYFNVDEVQLIRSRFLEGEISWVFPWLLVITELWCREVLDTTVHRRGCSNQDPS